MLSSLFSDSLLFVIAIDPESVEHLFGKSPLIYGISGNPEFMKMPHLAR